MQIQDTEILQKYKDPATRVAGFNLLVQKYQQKIYWHIRRLVLNHDDANDVVQNTFIKVWNGFDTFRADAKLYTWLYRIATNEALTFLNKKNRRIHISTEEAADEIASELVADKYFNGDEVQLKLQQAIAILPDKQKIVFNLRYFDEMPYEEMSEILETSVGALKASYHHAVKKVEKYLIGD